jgi:hypothetical protein
MKIFNIPGVKTMADQPAKTSTDAFAKAALVIYAPDAASQEAAREIQKQVEQAGGKVEIRNQSPPWTYAGIH